jgi:TIR domain/Bacterial SH3 domain
MARIFISYRRSDSTAVTARIYQQFVARFGKANVFKDVNNIPIGKDFRAVIESELINRDLMLVIIGPNWLDTRDNQGNRRLDNPQDFVRIEVELGLRHVKVIPVLVNGAHMPNEAQLPLRLVQLAFLNAAVIHDGAEFENDVETLINAIAPRRRWPWVAVLTLLLVLVGGAAFAALNAGILGRSASTEAAPVPSPTAFTVSPSDTPILPTDAPTMTLAVVSTLLSTATGVLLPTATPTITPAVVSTLPPTSTETHQPTTTPFISKTPVPTDTNTPIQPTVDTTPRVTITSSPLGNIREGDSTVYNIIMSVSTGTTARIIGISNQGSGWFEILLDDGRIGWVSPTIVTTSGDLTGVPFVQPPPRPTSPPFVPSATSTGGGIRPTPCCITIGTAVKGEELAPP